MAKKIRFFRQHSMVSCGASCMLMLLDYYDKVQYPTKKQEEKLYKIFHSRAYMGIPAAAAADCLSRNGLSVSLLHSGTEGLENRDQYFKPDLFDAFSREYAQRLELCKNRVDIQMGVNITCDTLRSILSQDKQILLQCIVPGDADGIHLEVLHWIVVYGWDGDDFLCCDPLSSKLRISSQAMESYMDTPIGKVCIAVGASQ